MPPISKVVVEADVSLDGNETVADVSRPGRTLLSLNNQGADNVYVYYTSGAGDGYNIIAPGETWIDNVTNDIVYFKSAAGTNTVHKVVCALA